MQTDGAVCALDCTVGQSAKTVGRNRPVEDGALSSGGRIKPRGGRHKKKLQCFSSDGEGILMGSGLLFLLLSFRGDGGKAALKNAD